MTSPALSSRYVSVEEYLASERVSETKHEYVAGIVYDMAGAAEAHNLIAQNLSGILYNALRGNRCRSFGSDMQLRSLGSDYTCFYYPDAMVACDESERGKNWREHPALLFEILSESTRQIDERQKRLTYLQLGSLQAYVRIDQERAEVHVDRRTPEGWKTDTIIGRGSTLALSLREAEIVLPLQDLYEGVTFTEE